MLLALAAALLVLTAVLGSLLDMATDLLQTYTGEKLALDFRSRLFRHVQRLSLSYHDMTRHVGLDLPHPVRRPGHPAHRRRRPHPARRLGRDARGDDLSSPRASTCGSPLVALAVSPLLFLLSRSFGPRLRKNWKEVKQLDSSAMGVVQEVLAAVRVVKAFGQEDREHERFVDQSTGASARELEVSALSGRLRPAGRRSSMAVGSAAALYHRRAAGARRRRSRWAACCS